MNSRSPASFWPPETMPNSAACLMVLVVSPPALAMPMILALEACACSRNEEKSAVFSGCLTAPITLPPDLVTTAAVSGSSGGRDAQSDGRQYQVLPPAFTSACPVLLASI